LACISDLRRFCENSFGALLSAHQVSRAVGGRRIACDVRVLFFCVAGCDVAGTKIAGTADAQCVGPTAAAEEDTKIVLVATATGNEDVGFVIGFDGTKIVDVVIGFEPECELSPTAHPCSALAALACATSDLSACQYVSLVHTHARGHGPSCPVPRRPGP